MKSVLQNVGGELLRLVRVIAVLICPNNGTFFGRNGPRDCQPNAMAM
jgi:hypothetical protein